MFRDRLHVLSQAHADARARDVEADVVELQVRQRGLRVVLRPAT